MRVNTAFNHLLDLQGVWVRSVSFEPESVVVTVALRRRRLRCSRCDHSCANRYDTRSVPSAWRSLDLGAWRVVVRCRLRRLRCPVHGVVSEGVPFARAGSRFTRDFEDLVAYLAAKTDKTAVGRLLRVAWRTVGAVCVRVVGEELDPCRLDDLFEIGIDEVSWRRRHRYLTVVADHRTGKVVWAAAGKGRRTADRFFAELGTRSARLRAVSMDFGPAYQEAVRHRAPQAVVCFDPFHLVALATRALDDVRRQAWRQIRAVSPTLAAAFRGWRWVLLKNPENLTATQARTLEAVRADGGVLWRAYVLKESLRSVFAGDLSGDEATELLGSWCERAEGSGLAPFRKLASTVRWHLEGIGASVGLGLTNARTEALNTKVRLITRRAYGFHSAEAVIALVMLTCGPITLRLPHERRTRR
jgi:transposase